MFHHVGTSCIVMHCSAALQLLRLFKTANGMGHHFQAQAVMHSAAMHGMGALHPETYGHVKQASGHTGA